MTCFYDRMKEIFLVVLYSLTLFAQQDCYFKKKFDSVSIALEFYKNPNCLFLKNLTKQKIL